MTTEQIRYLVSVPHEQTAAFDTLKEAEDWIGEARSDEFILYEARELRRGPKPGNWQPELTGSVEKGIKVIQ